MSTTVFVVVGQATCIAGGVFTLRIAWILFREFYHIYREEVRFTKTYPSHRF